MGVFNCFNISLPLLFNTTSEKIFSPIIKVFSSSTSKPVFPDTLEINLKISS
jgi:hypothetical protein